MTRAATKPVTTTSEDQPPRFVLGASNAVGILLPDNVACTPSETEVLNTEAVQAYGAMVLAGQQARAAKAATKQADAIDRAADASATAADLPLPERRAAAAAGEALQLANRRSEAAHQNARDCMT